jgi:hypothetical protein
VAKKNTSQQQLTSAHMQQTRSQQHCDGGGGGPTALGAAVPNPPSSLPAGVVVCAPQGHMEQARVARGCVCIAHSARCNQRATGGCCCRLCAAVSRK